jgi:hypothetical protein
MLHRPVEWVFPSGISSCFNDLNISSDAAKLSRVKIHRVRILLNVALISISLICVSCGGAPGPVGDRYVWITPRNVTIQTGRTWQFSADVVGADREGVDWSTSSGWIDSDGHYTAPSYATNDRITAISKSDPTLSDRIIIKVVK